MDNNHLIDVLKLINHLQKEAWISIMLQSSTVKISKRSGKSITLTSLLDEIPIDAARFFFNMREVCNGVERSKSLRHMEHIARIEELVFVLPPPFATLRAEILALELPLHDLASVLHLRGDNILSAVEAEHEVGALVEVDSENLRDMGLRLGFVVETHRARP